MPTFSFAGPLDSASFTVFSTGGGTDAFVTDGGVTFTLSAPGGNYFYISAGGGYISAQNNYFTGTQTMTLTWDGGALASQALNPMVTGTYDAGEIKFITSGGGSVNAVSGVTYTGQITAIKFVLSGLGEQASIGSITVGAINCFVTGTRIATPDGIVAVETLGAGDAVLLADGRQNTVKWLGEQPVNTKLSNPMAVNPIRISAGALGAGLPLRDLLISPDHAIEIDGVLYNAGSLVNGTSIRQVAQMPMDGFTYYHVETDAHELLLAEGVAAETFIDYAGRDSFVNGDESTTQIAEMPLPRVSSARMLPRSLRQRLNIATPATQAA